MSRPAANLAATIRPMQPADMEAVGQVAYATGYFGASAARYFPAPRLFALLWVGAYFRGAGFGCFVAELDGQVVGYILGAPTPELYSRGLWRAIAQIPGALPPPARLPRAVYYLLRMWHFAAPHIDEARYPAHLHINLLPAARGHRLGERLLRAHLQTLAGAGVPGVHLSTTSENVAALGLYRKLGFSVLAAQPTPLWRPWLGRDTTQLLLGLELRQFMEREM